MNIKNILSKVGKVAKDKVTDESIEKIVKDLAEKLKINIDSKKINSIVKTIKSKVKDIDLEKITKVAETEIKKIIEKK